MDNIDKFSDKKVNHQIIKDDEIDLIALVKTIWESRKVIYYAVSICVFLGLIIALVSPARYSSSVTLMPIESSAGNQLGNLGALAGMAGINIGGMSEGVVSIPAELYPEIVESFPFQKDMINRKFSFSEYDEPISYFEYAKNDTVDSFGAKLLKYTIKLPWTIKDYLKRKTEINGGRLFNENIILLSEKEVTIYLKFSEYLKVNFNNKTGIVTINSEYNEPLVVAQMVNEAVGILQKYVTDFKTKQVRQNLDFIQERYNEKEKEYTEMQKKLFEYRDNHRNIVSERVSIEYQRLNDDYDLITSIYKSLAKQLEQAKISVSENTPAFSIIEPVKVPLEKSGPRKIVVLVLAGLLGGFLGISYIFIKTYFFIAQERWNTLS